MSSIPAARRRITMERRFEATLEEVWELWTTREGIESWWGPEGFSVTVKHLELREGGHLDYDMVATDEGTIAFMKANGMPVSPMMDRDNTSLPVSQVNFIEFVVQRNFIKYWYEDVQQLLVC